MQPTLATTVFLPLALGIIMLGLGLSLTIEDFRRVVLYPRAVIVGLVCQMVLLPAVCFGIATLFHLPPPLAVGLMLLAASPGGATANLFSHLAHGDVALNITLTAINSVLTLLTLPLLVNFAVAHFLGADRDLPMPFDKVIQVFAVVLVPVAIGMTVKRYRANFADRLAKPVRLLSALLLLLIVLVTLAKESGRVGEMMRLVGGAALLFNLASMAVGYFVPLAVRLPKAQAVAIGMEIGIHNSTLAITIASSPVLLNDPTMAIPAAIYSLIMFLTAAVFGWLVNRRRDAAA